MSDAKLPIMGNVPKPALLIAGAAGLGIIGYAYWRRSSGSGSSVDTTVTDPTSDIDPATGLPYADEFGALNSGFSLPGINDPVTGGVIGTGSGTGTGVVTPSSNAAWSQEAEAYLIGIAGFSDPTVVAAALGNGLSGRPLTPDQLNIWTAAVAFEGEPPQGHPPIISQPAGGGSTSPKVLPAPTGLRVTERRVTSVNLDWNDVPGATHYRVYDNHSKFNVADARTSNVTIGGLAHNTSYQFWVRAVDATQTLGNPSTKVTTTTLK